MKEKEIQKRGQLTDRIKQKSKDLLGYEINELELRIMPYIQYVMLNERKIDIKKINIQEEYILLKWEKLGFIKMTNSYNLSITQKFWDDICEIIYLGYVDLR